MYDISICHILTFVQKLTSDQLALDTLVPFTHAMVATCSVCSRCARSVHEAEAQNRRLPADRQTT